MEFNEVVQKLITITSLFDDFLQAPVPAEKWTDDIFDASKVAQPCPQFDAVSKKVVGSEDCLYLNVYTPQVSSSCFKFIILFTFMPLV